MKKYLLLVLVGIFSCLQLSAQSSNNASPKHEFRATWFTTWAGDWQKIYAVDNAKMVQQQNALKVCFDSLARCNVNAVCFQVRSRSDVFYESSYEPWAKELTGTLGKYPLYDPLEFAIDEAHKRGMELHAWVNPFRLSSATDSRKTEDNVINLYKAPDGKQKLQWSWVIPYDNASFTGQIIDPGFPAARKYVVNVLMEIVNKYDIDGIVMDDYFYGYGGTADNQDQNSQSAHFDADVVEDENGDGKKMDDWRRSNVDAVIEAMYDSIQIVKPWVRFGMGPGGIWSTNDKVYNKYEIRKPQNIDGAADPYTLLYCNTVKWVKEGWVDYVNPQIYWSTTISKFNYKVLCEWWAKDVCEHFSNKLEGNQRVHFYPSQTADKAFTTDNSGTNVGFGTTDEEGIEEIIKQINTNRNHLSSGYTGSVFFKNSTFLKMSDMVASACYQQKALVPPMAWKSTGSLEAPTELSISGNTLTWKPEGGRYTIYVYPKEVEMNTAIEQVDYLQRVVYGNSFTLPAEFNTATHNVAVRSYDRYGVEHAATEYTPDVTYVLNGGVPGNRTVESTPNVPTQDELIAAFKTGYNSYFGASVKTTREIINFLYAGSAASDGGNKCDISKMMTDVNSGWKWLGDYIIAKAGAPNGTIEYWWRRNVGGFFIQGISVVASVNSFDFSTAGQPENWGPAYQVAHKTTTTVPLTLPEKIEGSAFTLPIAGEITHPNGSTFLGWYDNPDMTGNKILALRVGYKGTVYAKWSGITWMLYGGQYTGGTLPGTVNATYTLPTKTQMQRTGFVFGGWYEKADFSGNVLTSIDAGYTGVLHAKWIPANHVTWHPYPYYDVTNEDLWEQFMEDYNDWYMNHSDQKISAARAEQPITNAFGFMFNGETVDGTKEGAKKYPDGLAKDFMTNPNSPWKWLGDYIAEIVEKENEQLESNDPLWTAFKEATGLTKLGALKDMTINKIAGNGFPNTNNTFTINTLNTLFNNEEWGWLKTYIMTEQNTQAALNKEFTDEKGYKRKITTLDSEITENNCRNWVFAIAAFFTQSQYIGYPAASADFSEKGKRSVWKNTYHGENAHYQITKELDWRKMVHTFFNAGNTIQYVNIKGEQVTEGTADFSTKGLPKPNGDPAAGWYNAWWNATFPEYMIDNEALPKIKRKNYVFGGWYYGNEKGYIFTEGTKAAPDAYSSANNYKNHLWGRWLELCLYEGYVDSDPAALDANEQPISPKVNNNVEMVICNAEEIARTGLSRKVDIERKLIGGTYNTMFLPFGINGQGTVKKDDDGNYISGSGICGKKYYLNQVVDDDGNPLLDPATTSILVYDTAEIENVGGEEVIAFNFHEYAEADSLELLLPYQPFLIKPANDITVRMHFWSALMNKPKTPKARTDAYQVFVEGVLAPTMLPVNPEYANTLILVADNRLAKVTTQGEMLGLRLYFTVPKDVSPSAQSIIRVNNAPAGIDDIETPQQGAAVIKIMQNGNIYIIRNGKMYDIMGREIGDR